MKQLTDNTVIETQVSKLHSISNESNSSQISNNGTLPVLENAKDLLNILKTSSNTLVDEIHNFAGKIQNVANKKYEDDAQDSKSFGGH